MAREVIGGSGLTREELEAVCASLGKTIGEVIPAGTAFAFLLADFGEEGNAAYLSNAKRPDMVKMLREMADRIEGMPHGAH